MSAAGSLVYSPRGKPPATARCRERGYVERRMPPCDSARCSLLSTADYESISVVQVDDLHAADAEGGDGEQDRGQGEEAADGDPSRGGVGEEGEGAFGERDRAEGLEVVDHGELLEDRGQQEVDGLPAEEGQGREGGAAEEEAEGQEGRAVAGAGEGGHQQVGAEVGKARTVPQDRPAQGPGVGQGGGQAAGG